MGLNISLLVNADLVEKPEVIPYIHHTKPMNDWCGLSALI